MGKDLIRHFLKDIYTSGQQVYENILNITNHNENENQNHDEILSPNYQNGCYQEDKNNKC